ncbi:hypothetical protein HK405_007301, partial [Cladochytrium tenue]
RLGATAVLHGADFDEAKKECARLAALHGLTNIPPYDDPYVIAGQGTIGVEILRQAPPPTPAAADAATSGSAHPPTRPVDAVFVCVGGGGLAAGIAAYIKRVCPAVRIVGVETYDADAMTRSLRAGHRVELAEVSLFADSAAVRSVGVETFRVCSEFIDEMVLVGSDEICAAIKDIFEDTHGVYIQEKGLTGGIFVAVCNIANMDFTRLRFVADRADLGEEREALFCTAPSTPVAVTKFAYRFADPDEAVVFMGFQVAKTRYADVAEIPANLQKLGMVTKDVSDDVSMPKSRSLE